MSNEPDIHCGPAGVVADKSCLLKAAMQEARNIHPNLDFPSGPACYALGFEVHMSHRSSLWHL